MLVFVNPKAGFSDSAAFDFSSGGVAGNVSVKKLIRMFGPSSGVDLELRRIISNQKWVNACLVLRYRSWMICHHGHLLAKQEA